MLPTLKIMKKLLKYFLLCIKWILIPIAAFVLMCETIVSFIYYLLEEMIDWLYYKIKSL